MSFKELLESWRETAAAPRTASTFAVRLPLDEAAQLAALKELAAAMPYVAGKRVISTDEQGDPIYEDVGPTPRFMALTRTHRRSLEVGSKGAGRSPRKSSPRRRRG